MSGKRIHSRSVQAGAWHVGLLRRGVVARVRCAKARLQLSGPVLRDKDGLTTVGVAIALLVSITLVFSASQVYRINSASAETQSVADAAALAAMNEVGEFVIVARVCDATVLSLTLTGLSAMGLGLAALCTPLTFELSGILMDAGKKVLEVRDSFAQRAEDTLNQLQRALPVLAAANAAGLAAANGNGACSYMALAVLVPWEGEEIGIEDDDTSRVVDDIEDEAGDIRAQAEAAEEAALQASEAKRRAYEHDCGLAPSYCMYERALTLAGMQGALNPRYGSADAWSFSAALNRAKAYYAHRLTQEAPEGSSVADQARSALRKQIYAYAVEQMETAYVREGDGSFSANFPLLPKNTAELRGTDLYTREAYPVTSAGEGLMMHAWPGCPRAGGAIGSGSIAQLEAGGYTQCPECEFTVSSLGKVAAASSSIENGFEYHYRIVAQAARDYQQARQALDPVSSEVKGSVSGLLDEIAAAVKDAAGTRIKVSPPGSTGAVAIVVCDGSSVGFQSGFISGPQTTGMRAAVSAATLLEEPAGEGGDVVSSVLDSLDGENALLGGAGIVLDCWSGMLRAYGEGQQALSSALSGALDSIPFASASGLGEWAANAFSQAMEEVGLEPANLDAAKPVLVNSYYVASQGTDSFSAALLSFKQQAGSGGALAALAGIAGQQDASSIASGFVDGDKSFEVASVRIFGDSGPEATIKVTLSAAAQEGLLTAAIRKVQGVYAQVTGETVWR